MIVYKIYTTGEVYKNGKDTGKRITLAVLDHYGKSFEALRPQLMLDFIADEIGTGYSYEVPPNTELAKTLENMIDILVKSSEEVQDFSNPKHTEEAIHFLEVEGNMQWVYWDSTKKPPIHEIPRDLLIKPFLK